MTDQMLLPAALTTADSPGAAESPADAGRAVGRIPITDVRPLVLAGDRPARAVPEEPFEISATIYIEGHQSVGAQAVLTAPDGSPGDCVPMTEVSPGSDRYSAEVTAAYEGDWTYRVEAWSDPVAAWRHVAELKIPAALDVEVTLETGARLLGRAAARPGIPAGDVRVLREAAASLRDTRASADERLAAALTEQVAGALTRAPLREMVTASRELRLRVERGRALYGAWYEFFPRSEGAEVDPAGFRPPRSGTLRTAARRLPAIAAMGFDVIYLPPIHPIGITNRKGPGNSPLAGPHDPGSPWAIGSAAGGHDAVHPDLGTIEDFDLFVDAASGLGLEVALDFALQCSPDHPWVTAHPDWFARRPDGTIAYAENPPKKYQDIYPVDFSADFDGILAESLRVLRHWMSHGVRIFRVDNPHTKPTAFWERLIAEVHRTDPGVIFLAEAFTRPAVMRTLAAVGFQQSYTYFTWRNTKAELTGFLRDITGETAAYMRPNLFVNTPDILHAYLQDGGSAAFRIRAVLAATASPAWGVYAGFELGEAEPAAPGSEEYRDSEKYQYRPRDWSGAEQAGTSLAPFLSSLNLIRRRHRALQLLRNLRLHETDDDAVLCFSKKDRDDVIIVVVNLDPHSPRETTVHMDLPELGGSFRVRDELTGSTHQWGARNYVRLDPARQPAHIFTVDMR